MAHRTQETSYFRVHWFIINGYNCGTARDAPGKDMEVRGKDTELPHPRQGTIAPSPPWVHCVFLWRLYYVGVLITPLAMGGPAPHPSLDAVGDSEPSEALMRKSIWRFPGGSVVKNLPDNAGHTD